MCCRIAVFFDELLSSLAGWFFLGRIIIVTFCRGIDITRNLTRFSKITRPEGESQPEDPEDYKKLPCQYCVKVCFCSGEQKSIIDGKRTPKKPYLNPKVLRIPFECGTFLTAARLFLNYFASISSFFFFSRFTFC